MVKNTTGGTGTKSLARKHQQFKNTNNKLRLPECDLEQFACVTKMLGNGMCEVFTNTNIRLIARIRNAFRGKNKRHNMVTPYSIILIGLHEWEKIPKNCDLLFIYEPNHVEIIKNNPQYNINHLVQLQLSGSNIVSHNNHADIDFVENEQDDVPPQQIPNDPHFEVADNIVNIDDI